MGSGRRKECKEQIKSGRAVDGKEGGGGKTGRRGSGGGRGEDKSEIFSPSLIFWKGKNRIDGINDVCGDYGYTATVVGNGHFGFKRAVGERRRSSQTEREEEKRRERMDSQHEMRSYNSLLQPIRDLTENWDIDVAHLLEEYLDDLESIRFTVNHNDSTLENLNFAEAALVIQGSTTIYSKKVEYLYQLVHHALELMSQTNSQSNQSNQGKNDKTKVRESLMFMNSLICS
jgi:hypothetical protein